MVRLRNTLTGTVVDVDDDTAARLGRGYVPAEQPKSEGSTPEPKPAPKRRAPVNKK